MKFRHLISPEEKWKTLPLYEASFPEDRGTYARYYYQWKCRENEVLVLTAPVRTFCTSTNNSNDVTENISEKVTEEICAMLHLNPYRMWIATQSVMLHYIVAVATALPYRRQGCMRMLLQQAFRWMYQQEEPFTYLMPANTLYYEPFGFRVIYDQTPVSFPADIEKANQQAKEQFDVVTLRDENYLRFLEAEPKIEESAVQKAQIMCRIIHAKRFLECLRANSPQKINLFLKDLVISDNTGWYCWQVDESNSKVQPLKEKYFPLESEILPNSTAAIQGNEVVPCLIISIEELAEQLFGIAPLHPVLSQIKILKRICINEEV